MTDNVPPPPDQNEPPQTPQTPPPPADPIPQPGPYVYSPQTGEQPQAPLPHDPQHGAPAYGAPQQGAPPAAPPTGPAPTGRPPQIPYPGAAPGTVPGSRSAYGLPPSGAYPAGAYFADPHAAPVDTRDPRDPHPGLPFGSSYRTPRTRWWKGAISIVVVIVAMLVFSLVLSIGAVIVDMLLGMQDVEALTEGRISMTPAVLAATNLSLVAGAGVALVAHRWINGVRFGYFHSVLPGLRWNWLMISFAIVAPVYLLFAASSFLDPAYQSLTLSGTTVAFLLIIVLTTPLQAAAEEYMFRGVVQRSVGGWFRSDRWGFIVGTAVSATVFSAAHFAADIWLIVYYLLFGVLLSFLTQRTGGLESAIAIHTANNVFLLIVASLADQMDAGFDRSAGTGGPVMLVPLAILAVVVAGLSWFAKKRKLTRTTGGAAAEAAAPAVPATASGAGHPHPAGAAPAGSAPAGSAPATATTGPIPISAGDAGPESFTEGHTATDPRYAGATTGPIPTDIGRVAPHAPGTPGTPDAPNTPGAPGTPGTTGTPDAPNTPGAPGTPNTPDAPHAPGEAPQGHAPRGPGE